jgi:hypothetical protein
MRKWMRERLQRRKKQAEEQESQPAPPPLQPAYFNAEEAAGTEPGASHTEPVEITGEEPGIDAPPSAEEPTGSKSQQPRSSSGSGGGARAKGRRRRGGRGRGGRGREQAVAQAFTPKGVPGGGPAAETEAPEPEASEPEASAIESGVGAEAPEVEAVPEPVPQAPPAPVIVPSVPARPPKGVVVLAIGLPGSGKSTWFKRHNVAPLSSDMVRSLLFDDVREQRFQDLVFSNLRSMLKARLIARRPTNYVDATNLTPQERQHWIKLAKDYNYEVHAVFFDVPLEVCIERH